MKKILTKEEIDKILKVDPNERIATNEEIERIVNEIKRVETEKGIPHGGLSNDEIDAIMKNLGLGDIKLIRE